MAEIPIQEKRGGKSWLWIVARLAIALLAWMVLANDRDDVNAVPATETGTLTPAPTSAPIALLRVAA